MSSYHVIIAAAGMGTRLEKHLGEKKQFFELGGKPIFQHAIEKFFTYIQVATCILVVPSEEEVSKYDAFLKQYPNLTVVPGGKERQDSIANALKKLEQKKGIVLIHDAVRPFFTKNDVTNVITEAESCGAAVLAARAKDTIRTSEDGVFSSGTLDRKKIWQVQTPQAFDLSVLQNAHKQAFEAKIYETDDAALVERLGVNIALVESNQQNFKITDPFDLEVAEYIFLKEKNRSKLCE